MTEEGFLSVVAGDVRSSLPWYLGFTRAVSLCPESSLGCWDFESGTRTPGDPAQLQILPGRYVVVPFGTGGSITLRLTKEESRARTDAATDLPRSFIARASRNRSRVAWLGAQAADLRLRLPSARDGWPRKPMERDLA